ncbi:predicted protein [Nematostella vectensis]|uniref:F5/8 type C domain-containing protein n=1 Tax=Nematostella vectensis TaxID=45351 RepID=A7RK21_NEMVE|nr:predicted protein [Nematostella vectensis]|eukprot:XP_001640152.1 predicted protein [Nematostella vectensis]
MRPLGIQNRRRVPNRHLSASSRWDRNHGANRGRLNARRHGSRIGAWSARTNNRYQWIQVYFPRPKTVTNIATQGRQDANQWVKSYYVTFSVNGVQFVPYKVKGKRKIFRGNKNRNSITYNTFNPPIKALFVRIHPVSWHAHISLRFELYGFPASE